MHDAVNKTQSASKSSYKGQHTPRNWWNDDCLVSRDRQRFWYSIWKSCDRPRCGHVYDCYKLAKRGYRKSCRLSVNSMSRIKYNKLDSLYHQRDSKTFWNMVRSSKTQRSSTHGDISISALTEHYTHKFSLNETEKTDIIATAGTRVETKYSAIRGLRQESMFSEDRLTKYVNKLKSGCAPGHDGIMSEHLKLSLISPIMCNMMCSLYDVCSMYGIVPDAFTTGLLVPILKKPTSDPALPSSYRPITISCTFSKVLELFLLDSCGQYDFSDVQFGFIEGRGTNMAISLAHDVISHHVTNGSPVYSCALDAEGAFDAIPHDVLFYKSADVIPDNSWRMLVYWYKRLTVLVKWENKISNHVRVLKGTRQGGLSSPFLFNLFYKDMIELLNNTHVGTAIHSHMYNVFCYADDIMLTSLSASGLQQLIDCANVYIVSHGLKFNESKTQCITFGKSPLRPLPTWTMNDSTLQEVDSINYLGAVLTSHPSDKHINSRIQACRRAFYGLQGAGLCKNGANSDTIGHIWNVAVRPVLLYGAQCIYNTKASTKAMDKIQAKLIKAALGLKPWCKSTELLAAINIKKTSKSIDIAQLDLLKSALYGSSRCSEFYSRLLNDHFAGKKMDKYNLVTRCLDVCSRNNISVINYLYNDSYARRCQKHIIGVPAKDGVVDSVKYLLTSRNVYNSELLNLFLKPF